METENKCLKQLGILGMHSECPNGCPIVEITNATIMESGCCSKDDQGEIAKIVGKKMKCPDLDKIVLPRGSRRMI